MKKWFTKDKEELKKTKWIAEIIKALVVSFATIAVMFFARQFSPGNRTGKSLETYLQTEICNTMKNGKIEITKMITPYKGTYETLSEANVVVTYCEYITNTEKSGRIIALFERKKETLLNQILGSLPAYEISFIRFYEFDGIDPDNFYYTGIDVRDIDSDGSSEIYISLQSNFASRISHIELLLSKLGESWGIITPDITLMEKVREEAKENGYEVYFDNFDLSDPKNSLDKELAYGLSHEGMVYILKNPFSGGIDLCFGIAANDGTEDSSVNTHYVYFMTQLKNGALTLDENWNGGKLLILEEDKNFLNEKDLYWGYERIGNLQFYSSPNR